MMNTDATMHTEPQQGYQVVVYTPELRVVDRSWRTTDRSACEVRAKQLRDSLRRLGWNYTVRIIEA